MYLHDVDHKGKRLVSTSQFVLETFIYLIVTILFLLIVMPISALCRNEIGVSAIVVAGGLSLITTIIMYVALNKLCIVRKSNYDYSDYQYLFNFYRQISFSPIPLILFFMLFIIANNPICNEKSYPIKGPIYTMLTGGKDRNGRMIYFVKLYTTMGYISLSSKKTYFYLKHHHVIKVRYQKGAFFGYYLKNITSPQDEVLYNDC